VKAGQPARPKTVTEKGEIMTQYLVAIHHPAGSARSLQAQPDGKVLFVNPFGRLVTPA
jgi:hypothetical protein